METAAPAPAPIDLARVTSARRALGVLLALAVLLPAGCEALFARQSRRLETLAAQGQTTVGAVIAATDQTTEYRYEVDGRTHTWNVAREHAPHPVGAAVTVRYLPADPSFSRPTDDPEVVRRELAAQRRVAAAVVVAVGLFFLSIAAMTLRELRRALRGVDPRSDEALRARRREALAFCGVAVLGVGLAHAQDARGRGESLVPVALGVVLGAAVLVGTIAHLTGGGAAELSTRQARLWRWLGPAAAAIASLRLLAWLLAR
ncbi:MAG: hypothetical protein U0325_30955 [Polyangiales bacterium]